MSKKKQQQKKRVKRPPAEVLEQLQEQVGFLVSSCKAFDDGNHTEAKRLATQLRVLLHSGKPPSVALLGQLGSSFSWKRFHSMMIPNIPQGSLSYQGLIMTKIQGGPEGTVCYLPTLDSLKDQFFLVQTFLEWWEKAMVIKAKEGETFTRKELVLAVANTDGGAHVDQRLEESYYKLSRENSLGWIFHAGDREWFENPVPASIRQVAHELLRTLEAQGFETDYHPPEKQ